MSAVRVKTIGAVYISPNYFLPFSTLQIGQDESSVSRRRTKARLGVDPVAGQEVERIIDDAFELDRLCWEN